MTNKKMLDNALYALEKDHGGKLVFRRWSYETNLQTGKKKITDLFQSSVKAILLPVSLARKFWQDVGFLRANSNFTMGGLNDLQTTTFIVRKSTLKCMAFDLLEGSLSFDMIFSGLRYEKKSITDIETAFILEASFVQGSLPFNVQDVTIAEHINLEDTV